MPSGLTAMLIASIVVFIVEFVAPVRDRLFRRSVGLPVQSQDEQTKTKILRTRLLRGALMFVALSYGLYRTIEQSQPWTIATASALFVYVVFANWRAVVR